MRDKISDLVRALVSSVCRHVEREPPYAWVKFQKVYGKVTWFYNLQYLWVFRYITLENAMDPFPCCFIYTAQLYKVLSWINVWQKIMRYIFPILDSQGKVAKTDNLKCLNANKIYFHDSEERTRNWSEWSAYDAFVPWRQCYCQAQQHLVYAFQSLP